LAAILIAENPIGCFSEIFEVDDFVGVNEGDDIFNHILMQEEIGGPEVERTKPTCGRFHAPLVECIAELGGAQRQRMRWPFGTV
jgi:hypothetical protein